jgi:hypothetical protein
VPNLHSLACGVLTLVLLWLYGFMALRAFHCRVNRFCNRQSNTVVDRNAGCYISHDHDIFARLDACQVIRRRSVFGL